MNKTNSVLQITVSEKDIQTSRKLEEFFVKGRRLVRTIDHSESSRQTQLVDGKISNYLKGSNVVYHKPMKRKRRKKPKTKLRQLRDSELVNYFTTVNKTI